VKPASRIEQAVKLARSAGNKQFGSSFGETVGRPLDAIEKAAVALSRWSQLPLQLLRRDKRRARRVDLREAAMEVCRLLEPFMTEAQIALDLDLPEHELPIFAMPAAVEAIVANLLVNSITAVVTSPTTPRAIRVSMTGEVGGSFASLAVADTGLGLQGIDADEIWLPGRTTREQGTGLGLTIVRDSAFDLGGTVTVVQESDLGGAEFLITMPMIEATGA
jgi:C4-dicarboxylate-specific signal transduction histidine kinase